jgi:hypothetical protein
MGGAFRRGVRNANEIFVRKPYVKRLLGRRGIYLFINDLTRKRTDLSNQFISWSRVCRNKFNENWRFTMFRRGHHWTLSWVNRIQCKLSHLIFSLHSFDTTRTAYKTTPPIILHCRGNVFTELVPGNDSGYTGRPTDCPLIRHWRHRTWHVQQFFCCNVYSLPQERVYRTVAWHRMEGYTYWWEEFMKEVHRWHGLSCHDIQIKLHKDWFRRSEVDGAGSHKPAYFFYRKVESSLKMIGDLWGHLDLYMSVCVCVPTAWKPE